MTNKRGSFGSRFGVVAAVGGSVVGLGNIWRFPYVAGENGGGAFIIIYILISFLIAVPIMLSEFSIGRKARSNSRRAFDRVAPETHWSGVGYLGIATAFVILSFYSVIAGWALEFFFDSIFIGFSDRSAQEINEGFNLFVSSGWRPFIWTLLFILSTAFIVSSGVKKGIERYNKILMPLLFIILAGLAINSFSLPGAKEGISFLLKPDFTKITTSTFLEALGQAFFSLSLGMGAMITYGSYIKKDENMFKVATMVSLSDVTVAILSGLVIFPAVFSFGISPTSGAELVFITLPSIFGQMMGGYFIAIIFFFLLFLAAITSTISLFEVIIAYLTEEMRLTRRHAVILAMLSIITTSTFCVMSQMPDSIFVIGESTLFDICNNISSIYMLPIGGFFIVLFTGWVMKEKVLFQELTSNGHFGVAIYPYLYFIIRYFTPIIIAILFLNQIGFIK